MIAAAAASESLSDSAENLAVHGEDDKRNGEAVLLVLMLDLSDIKQLYIRNSNQSCNDCKPTNSN